jgi:hypothetical protein
VLGVDWTRPLHLVVVVDERRQEERIVTVHEPDPDLWSPVPDNPPAPDRSAHWHVPGAGHELVVERLVGQGRRVVARIRLAVGLGLALQLGAALERLG